VAPEILELVTRNLPSSVCQCVGAMHSNIGAARIPFGVAKPGAAPAAHCRAYAPARAAPPAAGARACVIAYIHELRVVSSLNAPPASAPAVISRFGRRARGRRLSIVVQSTFYSEMYRPLELFNVQT
jgi:hypothetical protein